MKRTFHVAIAPGRRVGAWACLLALALLWVPLWAAAWQVNAMSCCDGGICAAHGHAGSKSGTKSHFVQENAPTECPQVPSGMVTCRLSCCQSHDYPVTSAVLFVLPEPMTISATVVVKAVELKSPLQAKAQLVEPLSPPPRGCSLIVA
jgi:hypothetical protein